MCPEMDFLGKDLIRLASINLSFAKNKQPTPSGVPLLKQAPNNRWCFQTHLKEHISQIGLQQNYNTPVEHTPGNPPSPL